MELVRRCFDELGTPARVEDVEKRFSDEALAEYFDPQIELVPIAQSLLAVDGYRGYEGVRRFWTELLSMWHGFRVDTQEVVDAGDQVALVIHVAGRSQDVEVDATWSSLCAVRAGRIIRVQNFSTRDGALEAAGLSE